MDNISREIVLAFGGLSKMARKTGIPISTIFYWVKEKKIPSWRYSQIVNSANQNNITLPDIFNKEERVEG